MDSQTETLSQAPDQVHVKANTNRVNNAVTMQAFSQTRPCTISPVAEHGGMNRQFLPGPLRSALTDSQLLFDAFISD